MERHGQVILGDGSKVLATVSMPTVCQDSFYFRLYQRIIRGLGYSHLIGEEAKPERNRVVSQSC